MNGKGPDRCPTCDQRILRYPTNGTLTPMPFDEDGRGKWVIHPLTGRMEPRRPIYTDLTRYSVHTCQ